MGRQITRADVKAVFDDFAPRAVGAFQDDGEAYPQVFYISLGAEPGSIRQFVAMHPAQLAVFMQGSEGKDVLGEVIRELLKPGSFLRKQVHEQGLFMPDIVVQIAEGWTAFPEKGKEKEFMESQKLYKGVADRPDRREGIFIFIHQHGRSDIGWCPILENPRRAEIGEVISLDEHWRSCGRLSMDNAEQPDEE